MISTETQPVFGSVEQSLSVQNHSSLWFNRAVIVSTETPPVFGSIEQSLSVQNHSSLWFKRTVIVSTEPLQSLRKRVVTVEHLQSLVQWDSHDLYFSSLWFSGIVRVSTGTPLVCVSGIVTVSTGTLLVCVSGIVTVSRGALLFCVSAIVRVSVGTRPK